MACYFLLICRFVLHDFLILEQEVQHESLYSTIAIVPLSEGRYLFSPVKPGKNYSFAIRVLTPDGQASRPFRISLILE